MAMTALPQTESAMYAIVSKTEDDISEKHWVSLREESRL